MSDYVVSLIRTWVPVGIGAAIAWLATLGLSIDSGTQTGLVAGLTGIIIAAYYALVRALEKKWPAFGVLLGRKVQPAYPK